MRKLISAAALALFLCGCGPNVLQLNETDNGKTISCSKGDQLVITLPANPTTGFTWQVYRPPSSEHLVLTESTFNELPQKGNQKLVGAPGTYSFFYTVTGPGKEGITLVYCRSWENNPPAGRFELLVDATE